MPYNKIFLFLITENKCSWSFPERISFLALFFVTNTQKKGYWIAFSYFLKQVIKQLITLMFSNFKLKGKTGL